MLKDRKKARKGFRDAVNAVGGLPSKCTQCECEFDLKRDADTWMVSMANQQIQLLCPSCSPNVNKKA